MPGIDIALLVSAPKQLVGGDRLGFGFVVGKEMRPHQRAIVERSGDLLPHWFVVAAPRELADAVLDETGLTHPPAPAQYDGDPKRRACKHDERQTKSTGDPRNEIVAACSESD
jgi:hypothetical protein